MSEPEPAPPLHEIPPARVVGGSRLATQIAVVAAIVVLIVGALVALHLLEQVFDLERWAELTAKLAVGGIGVFALLQRPYVRRWLAAISIDQWRAIDAETELDPKRNPHVTTLIVLLTCAISLTIQEYVGGADKYERWFPYDGGQYWELSGFMWWTAWRVIGYVGIPVIVILCMPGERLGHYHISGRGFFRHLWIYGVMFIAFSPIVIIASLSDSFRQTYPFYRMANRSQFDLWSWEALYIIQFIALEFFFRGFLLQALRRALGANAIFVMMVPYCMIHYGKPMAETLGAIGAGVVLGTLAMRTRSIWGGVMIHVGVATSMDVLALQGCPPIGSDEYCHT